MITVKENIYWVGHVDWSLRNFHGYSTPYGTTYNAYVVLDEKPTLIDTVKDYGFEEMLWRIKKVINPTKIQYIILNHTEMDHSGSIEKILDFCPQAEIICSPKGQESLKKHFGKSWKLKLAQTGSTLPIGKKAFKFFLTPMVHWPDSMVSYLETDKILFSNDAFGQHYASPERFADEAGEDIVFKEAAKYYANIVMPYGEQVLKALEFLQSLPLDKICPSHGVIWRQKQDIETIIDLYNRWGSHRTEQKALIIYDTMWHSTEKIAKKLYEFIDTENIPVRLINLKDEHISDIVAEILFAKVILLGSPILNNRIFPSVAGFLAYLKGLKPKNRLGFTFGSYGWSNSGFKELEDSLKESGIELISEGAYFRYVPTQDDLAGLEKVAVKIKGLLKED